MANTTYRGYPRVGDNVLADGKAAVNALADAVDADVAGLVSAMRLAAILQLTSSTTFTKGTYAGIKAVEVEVIGGGGGSGYAAATNGSQISFGGGGGGGAYAHGFILAGSLATSETVTVGAGGAGGTSGTPDGTDGGQSSFGAHLVAGGGTAGGDVLVSTASSGFAIAGFGGVPSGTALDLGVSGDEFGAVSYVNGSYTEVLGLIGHKSGGPYGVTAWPPFGVGAVPGNGSLAGAGIGSGARGPTCGTSQSARNGAAGSGGRVIVRVYV